jgi:preprotein translocase subunit YajC
MVLSQFLLPIILLVFFYLVLIRPQQKRQKETIKMQNELQKGDKVVTIGGLHGTVDAVDEDKVILRSPDGSRLTFEKRSVSQVVQKKESVVAADTATDK